MFGGTGRNAVLGGSGNDLILGGADVDTLTGGSGFDTFVFPNRGDFTPTSGSARELITDFVHLGDVSDLSDMDANSVIAGDQDFAFVGSAGFTASRQVRSTTSGGLTTIRLCTDFAGEPAGFIALTLTGSLALTTSDFVL